MKAKELAELRNKKLEELKPVVAEKQKELALLWVKIKAGKEKKFSKIKMLKREIAQILTIIREKEIFQKEQS